MLGEDHFKVEIEEGKTVWREDFARPATLCPRRDRWGVLTNHGARWPIGDCRRIRRLLHPRPDKPSFATPTITQVVVG